MFRVNYRPPESLPLHQRDFPPRPAFRARDAGRRDDGSHQLALMVALYIVAMLGGLILLGNLTTWTAPNTVSAEILAGR